MSDCRPRLARGVTASIETARTNKEAGDFRLDGLQDSTLQKLQGKVKSSFACSIRDVACFASIFLLLGPVYGRPLITPGEMLQYENTVDYVQSLSAPATGGPLIELVNPNLLSQAVKSPTRIELLFKPKDGAVNLSSFKVHYGKSRFDITSRILRKAKLGVNSILIEEAELPEGEHRFAISIADIQGRMSSQEFMVRVQ